MCDDSVTSEIWQDQFLESLSTDIFSDDYSSTAADDEESVERDRNVVDKISANFVAERATKVFKGEDPDRFRSLREEKQFTIECLRSSSVDLVGLQVWRGALLLADYILTHPDEFSGKAVLELAAGTGITSIVVAQLAEQILCTDVDRGEILSTIRRNFDLNDVKANVSVDEIDFFSDVWRSKLAPKLSLTQVVLVADVVYDPDLTRKFFSALRHVVDATLGSDVNNGCIFNENNCSTDDINGDSFNGFIDTSQVLSHDNSLNDSSDDINDSTNGINGSSNGDSVDCFANDTSYNSTNGDTSNSSNDVTIYFSIEKRNRVAESGSISAPNFELFVDLLNRFAAETGSKLIRIDLDFEQRFKCYDRVEELFMWKLVVNKSEE